MFINCNCNSHSLYCFFCFIFKINKKEIHGFPTPYYNIRYFYTFTVSLFCNITFEHIIKTVFNFGNNLRLYDLFLSCESQKFKFGRIFANSCEFLFILFLKVLTQIIFFANLRVFKILEKYQLFIINLKG